MACMNVQVIFLSCQSEGDKGFLLKCRLRWISVFRSINFSLLCTDKAAHWKFFSLKGNAILISQKPNHLKYIHFIFPAFCHYAFIFSDTSTELIVCPDSKPWLKKQWTYYSLPHSCIIMYDCNTYMCIWLKESVPSSSDLTRARYMYYK